MQQLKPQDAQFIYSETNTNFTHVTGCTIYDPSTAPNGVVSFDDIIEHVRTRLHTSPVFTRRLKHMPMELDFPYWIHDEHFHLEHHVLHGHLSGKCDWREFCDHMGRYHSRPMDLNRPLWEVYMITGLDVEWLPKGAFALATKLHHCAIDGASSIKFYSALCDIDNVGTPALDVSPEEADDWLDAEPLDPTKRMIMHNLTAPLNFAKEVVKAVIESKSEEKPDAEKEQDLKVEVPTTRFNADCSPHKTFDGTVFPIKDFQAIRKAVEGSTLNDVVLTLCGGGLRKYLEAKDELPEGSLVAMVPVNNRPQKTMTEADPGNNVTSITSYVHSDIADPVERLRAVSAMMHKKKKEKGGFTRHIASLSQHLPSVTQMLAAKLVDAMDHDLKVANMTVTNVPGPKQTLYFSGAKAIENFGLGPLGDGLGLFIATPSFGEHMCFSVTSTRDILPDPDFFMQCVKDAFAEMKSAAAKTQTPAKKGSAAKRAPTRRKTTKVAVVK